MPNVQLILEPHYWNHFRNFIYHCIIFFFKHAGELRIFVLEREGENWTPVQHLVFRGRKANKTHTHTHTLTRARTHYLPLYYYPYRTSFCCSDFTSLVLSVVII
uniref:Uncharacterized protein n=1 Tax=Arundo donax TaxID=35708 RepID=A0A0A9DP44_ARUDO